MKKQKKATKEKKKNSLDKKMQASRTDRQTKASKERSDRKTERYDQTDKARQIFARQGKQFQRDKTKDEAKRQRPNQYFRR